MRLLLSSWQQYSSYVSRFWGGYQFLCCMFVSLLRHSGFSTVSWKIFCGFSGLALAPFAVCFAVFWMVRRKSGWRIWFVFWLFWFAKVHVTTGVHVTVSYLQLFLCKDRALERDRPYQRKKNKLGTFLSATMRRWWKQAVATRSQLLANRKCL